MKIILLILILFCCPQFKVSAQKQGQERIDSILLELPLQKEDTNKVIILNDLSQNYWCINPEIGIKFGRESLYLATKLRWKKGISEANQSLGANYLTKSEYSKAIEFDLIGLKIDIEIGNKSKIASDLRSIGMVCENQSNYPKAIDYFFNSLKVYDEIGDKQGIAKVTGNIGSVYCDQGDYPKALEYYFKVLRIFETTGDKGRIAGTALKIAAQGIILCHNHPSGGLKPSAQDISLTKRIIEACGIMDLMMLDHLIIGGVDSYLSMVDEGVV